MTDSVLPEPLELVLGDQTLEIWPITIGQCTHFARAIEPVWPALAAAGGFERADWTALALKHLDTLAEAVAIATQLPRATVNKMRPDRFVVVLTAVLEVNADFFQRAVLPAMGAAATRLEHHWKRGSPTPASDSSAPATATPRCADTH